MNGQVDATNNYSFTIKKSNQMSEFVTEFLQIGENPFF